MIFLYDKNGRVASYSEEELSDYNKKIFKSKKIKLTDSEIDKLKQGYTPYVKKNKIVLIETDKIKNKNLIDNAKDINDLKEIIKNLI